MDAARAADMADPDRNPNFRRRWDAPPLKPIRPPLGGTSERAKIESSSKDKLVHVPEKFKRLIEVAG